MELNEIVTDYFKDPDFLNKFDYQNRIKEISYNDGIDDGISQGIDIGRSEGIDIGRSEGITLGQEMTAKNMLQGDFDVSVIEKVTGLSKTHIKKIQKEMNLCGSINE